MRVRIIHTTGRTAIHGEEITRLTGTATVTTTTAIATGGTGVHATTVGGMLAFATIVMTIDDFATRAGMHIEEFATTRLVV